MDHESTIAESQRIWLSGGGDGGPMRNGDMLRHSTWLGGEWMRYLSKNR